MDRQKVEELKSFIHQVDNKPELLHLPELAFFKTYLTKMGCTQLPAAPTAQSTGGSGTNTSKPNKVESDSEEEEAKVEEEEDDTLKPLDEDPIADYVSDGEEDDNFPGFRLEKTDNEVYDKEYKIDESKITLSEDMSDADMDKQGDLKQQAQDAVEDGNVEKAIGLLTECYRMGNVSAMMFAKRADFLLKQKKPLCAMQDCEEALKLNPDSAKATRILGMAQRRLGMWDEAHTNLTQAQRLDYDDTTEDHLKFVNKKYKKIADIKREQRLQADRIKTREREIRVQKARKEQKKAAERQRQREKMEEEMGGGGFPGMGGMPGGMGGMPGGMGGMPGGMPGMGGKGAGKGGMPGGFDPGMMNDIMSNPKVAAAFQDIMKNPSNMMKYMNDPEVGPVMMKLVEKMGPMMGGMGGGGMPGGMGGMPGGMGGMPGGMGGDMPDMSSMFGGAGGMPGGASSGGASNFANVEECD